MGDRVGGLVRCSGWTGASIWLVEGVGRGVGDNVGVMDEGVGGLGEGVSWAEGLFRLLFGFRSFLVWPCRLTGLGVGVGEGEGTMLLGVSLVVLVGVVGTFVGIVAITGAGGEGALEGGV